MNQDTVDRILRQIAICAESNKNKYKEAIAGSLDPKDATKYRELASAYNYCHELIRFALD